MVVMVVVVLKCPHKTPLKTPFQHTLSIHFRSHRIFSMHLLNMFTAPPQQDQMSSIAHRAFPTNPDMSMVLEAMYILQTEDEDFIHGPKTEDDENNEWGSGNGNGRRSPPSTDLLLSQGGGSFSGGFKPSVSFGHLPSTGSTHMNPPYSSNTPAQAIQLAVGRQPANLPPLAAATKVHKVLLPGAIAIKFCQLNPNPTSVLPYPTLILIHTLLYRNTAAPLPPILA